MKKLSFLAVLGCITVWAQYKAEPLAAPPPGLPSSYAGVLQEQGVKIVDPSGQPYCEMWFRKVLPSGPKSTESAVAFPAIPHGALLAVVRFPARAAERRGQTIKAGIYTLRYSRYPIDGDHQGVAPQRDFLLLTPAADDADATANPSYNTLVEWSRKASGTPHPAVLEIGPAAGSAFPSMSAHGERDWALNVKIGDTAMYIIVVGKSEG